MKKLRIRKGINAHLPHLAVGGKAVLRHHRGGRVIRRHDLPAGHVRHQGPRGECCPPTECGCCIPADLFDAVRLGDRMILTTPEGEWEVEAV